MNCLENVVGIKCLSSSSGSGLFLEDLNGINLKTAANIADSRFVSGLELLKSKRNFAIQAVKQDIEGLVLPYFRMNSLIDDLLIGEFKSNLLSSQPLSRGVKIKTKKSRLLRVRIKTIEIRIQEANFVHSVQIIDGNTVTNYGFETDSNGVAKIQVDHLTESNEVLVVMDNSVVTPFDASLKTGCSCYSKSTEFLIGWGWNGSTTTTSTFGLRVESLAECDNDSLFCLIGHKLGFAILYKTGIEIVKEWIASDRLNPVTIIDDGTEEFLLEEFSRDYKHAIKVLIEQIPELLSRVDDVCVVCNQSRYVEGTP
jgi:hypothetical protein